MLSSLPPLLPADPGAPFPPAESALRHPEGLLAIGGDLSPTRLLNAYRHGIFPWYSRGQPILWWSPDPRAVFRTGTFRLPGKFRRSLRSLDWVVRCDTAFDEVIRACASTRRRGQRGTWITADMQAAYRELQRLGYAHSIEVFAGERLVGGLYGVAVGRMFFGESMYSAESGGSKVALAALARRLHEWGFPLIDAQVENAHLLSLGAELMARDRFLRQVSELTSGAAMDSSPAGAWTARFGELAAADLAEAAGRE